MFNLKHNNPNYVFIDVRTPEEFAGVSVPGFKSVPLQTIMIDVNILDEHKDKNLYLMCRSGMRSSSATQIVKSANFTNVYNIQGGIMAWESQGYDVKK